VGQAKETIMSYHTIEVEGTLRADGTLLLDEKPDLPPGRVRVRVLPLVPPPAETLVDYVLRTRKELYAAGSKSLNDEEVTAWIEELRADDSRIEEAYRPAE
jgi:hypothetical protein